MSMNVGKSGKTRRGKVWEMMGGKVGGERK